jgi:hypothetical protein
VKWGIDLYVKNKNNKSKKKKKITDRLSCFEKTKNTAGAAKIRHPTSDMRNALLETPQIVTT